MAVSLHLLIIEDSGDDAQLMVRTIQRGGYDVIFERVETEAALRAALQQEDWDIILCDYTLPSLNAVRALEVVKESGRDLPFIIISGSIGEEMAIAALRGGVQDFMLKGNLARLVPAVERELSEARTRRERRQAEQKAREAMHFFETVVETANVIYLQLDTAGNVTRINSAAEEITGYRREELEGRNWGETVVPRDRYPQPWREFDRIVNQGEEPGTFENPILTKQGDERHILWKHNVIRDGDRVVGTISFGIDITERKRTQSALRASEELFRLVVDAVPAAILAVDPAGRITLANPRSEDMFGYSHEELIGRRVEQLLPEALRYQHAVDRAHYQGHPTHRLVDAREGLMAAHKSGREFPVEVGLTPFRSLDGPATLAMVMDITARRQADAALREAETRYRLLVERMPAVTYVISGEPPYRTLYVSPQVEQLLGFPPDEWRSDPDLWEKQLHPDDRQRVLAEDRASREQKRPFISEYRVLARDGRTVWLHDETHHIAEPGLEPFSQGIEFDITERKQAEEALRQAESQYRVLVEQLPMIVYVNSPEDIGQTIYVSPQVEAILGYTPEEWLKDPRFWQTAIHPDDRRRVMERVERSNLTREELDTEFRMIARDGRVVWFRDQAAPVLDQAGHTLQWQGLMIDITESKQREREWAAIAQLSQALRETQTVGEILPRLLDETLALVDSDEGSIWLLDPVVDRVNLAVQRKWQEQPLSSYPRGQNIPDMVIDGGQPIVAREFRNDPRIPEAHRSRIAPGTGGACVPLSAAGKTVGAMFVNVHLPREITTDEMRVLGALADLGGYAIHRAQLFEETVKHLDRLAALRSIDIAISSSFDLHMILSVVLDKVTRELQVDAADILLLKPDSLMLDFAAGTGFWTRQAEGISIPIGQGLPGRAVLQREISYGDSLQSGLNDAKRPFLLTEEKFVSYYGVPLVAKGKVKGVLELFNRSALAHDAEWMQFLEALAGQTAIAIDSSAMFQDLQRSNMELELAYDATIEGWSHALDLRDQETEGHTVRVTEKAIKLARSMGMGDEALIQLRRGGLLHDIGKMGVPDSVLLKHGRLTDDEWLIMRRHPQFAYDMLAPIAYLRPALDIPYCHHERWDGNGYPRGLRREQIPLPARIFAVVDVWDALSSDRPYRPAWKTDDVLRYIRIGAGKHFDPAAAEAFLSLMVEESIKESAG